MLFIANIVAKIIAKMCAETTVLNSVIQALPSLDWTTLLQPVSLSPPPPSPTSAFALQECFSFGPLDLLSSEPISPDQLEQFLLLPSSPPMYIEDLL